MFAAASNSLRDELRLPSRPDPCAVVIFGASGDLTYRKLAPALYQLARAERLAREFTLVGFARAALSDAEFRERLRAGMARFAPPADWDEPSWQRFSQGVFYLQGTYDGSGRAYEKLQARLGELQQSRGAGNNALFYIATPPVAYESIIQGLARAGLARAVAPAARALSAWRRLVIEKPFGTDLHSAEALNRELLAVFAEDQVFRIDHYLGKETVQNILMLRFANSIFEPLWNQKFIDHVQITAAESLGTEDRAGYYDSTGALRDMVQNHLLQLLMLVAMEPPVAFDADAVRDEKAKVLRAIRPFQGLFGSEVVRGQYAEGMIAGAAVPGYHQEKGVQPDSKTETFVALKLFVDNWRWADVPFFLRTGKRLPKQATEIAIVFRRTPHSLFAALSDGAPAPNVLVLRIQPNEGISLRFEVKLPGLGVQLRPVKMDFRYGSSFGAASPSAYETLLLDALRGDSTLFTRRDEVEYAWRVLDPLLAVWKRDHATLPTYPAGTWGPAEADALIAATGRTWRCP